MSNENSVASHAANVGLKQKFEALTALCVKPFALEMPDGNTVRCRIATLKKHLQMCELEEHFGLGPHPGTNELEAFATQHPWCHWKVGAMGARHSDDFLPNGVVFPVAVNGEITHAKLVVGDDGWVEIGYWLIYA